MEKRHILLICPDGMLSDLVKRTGTLAVALAQMGYRVSIWVAGVGRTPLQELQGAEITVYHTPPQKMFFGWLNQKGALGQYLQALYYARQLQQTIRKDQTIDIVHFIDLRPPFGLLVKGPYLLQMPIVGEVHHREHLMTESFSFLEKRGHLKGLKALEPLIVNSNALLDIAHNQNLGHMVYIPPGVRVDWFKPVLSKRPVRRELGLPERATLVCCMADITPQNAQLEALERCFPLSAERQLILIGKVLQPEYLAKIMARASSKGMGAYVHVLDAEHMPEAYLKACDVFILLGGIEERHSTILEAQSAGLPVVLGASESSLMLCNGNRSGVVLSPNNALARQSFLKILSDPAYRQGKALNARPFVVKSFTFREMMACYDRLYQSL